MRTPPTNWTTIMAQPHETETRIDIAGVSYYGYDGNSGIWSCETRPMLFDKLSVGNCCSATINLVLVNPQTIPTMAKMELYVRLTNGTLTTPWVRKGVYYIDTREWDAQHEFLTITGYDAMLKTEQNYFTPPVTITGWPKTDAAVVSEICTRIGVELDTRTVINKGYMVQLPAVSSDGSDSDTLREVLGWIGAMYGGNWCITDEGKLRLVPLVPTDTVSVGTDALDLSTTPAYDAIGVVHLVVSEDAEYRSPQSGGTGRSIEISCPWGTQDMADNILAAIGGYVYQPLTVTTATEANPLWELGDAVTVNGYTSVIASMTNAFGLKYTTDIEAPESEEINHEYPYQDKGTRTIERKIAQSSASLRVDIDSIRSEVSGKITTFRQATVPTALAAGDLWYCTATITGTPSYEKDTWYRWDGSSWEKSSEDINVPVAPAWSSGTSYQKGDVVDEGGVWYAAKSNHTATSANKPPNSTYWEIRSTISEISKSQISQTMSEIALSVNESSLRLTGGGIDITAPTANLKVNAANITGTLTVGWGNVSGKPSFSSVATSGSYNDLSNKPSIPTDYSITTIIENTVTTGFVDALGVSAVELIGNSVYLRDENNRRAATLHLTGDRSSWDMRELEIESGNVYINSNADFVVITGGNGGRLTFSSEVIAESDFTCSPAGGHDLGYSSRSNYWRDLFIENDPTVVSDRNKKKEINYDISDMDGFFDDLKPAAFRFINGSSGRRHFGMIAQDVEENLAAHGIDPIDFAGFCKDTAEDYDGKAPEKGDGYALRYGEFISLCIDQIQKLKARVKSLETAS